MLLVSLSCFLSAPWSVGLAALSSYWHNLLRLRAPGWYSCIAGRSWNKSKLFRPFHSLSALMVIMASARLKMAQFQTFQDVLSYYSTKVAMQLQLSWIKAVPVQATKNTAHGWNYVLFTFDRWVPPLLEYRPTLKFLQNFWVSFVSNNVSSDTELIY